MVQILQAQNRTLRDLIDRFGLERVDQLQFFLKWQEKLPDLSNSGRDFLDKVRQEFLNWVTCPPLPEKSIQFAVISPIFFASRFPSCSSSELGREGLFDS